MFLGILVPYYWVFSFIEVQGPHKRCKGLWCVQGPHLLPFYLYSNDNHYDLVQGPQWVMQGPQWDKSMGSSMLVTVDESFARNKNVLIIHKVRSSPDKKFIWIVLDLVSLSENREKVSGFSGKRENVFGLSENREKVLGNKIANIEKVLGLSDNREKVFCPSENREKVLGNKIANIEKVLGPSENREKVLGPSENREKVLGNEIANREKE